MVFIQSSRITFLIFIALSTSWHHINSVRAAQPLSSALAASMWSKSIREKYGNNNPQMQSLIEELQRYQIEAIKSQILEQQEEPSSSVLPTGDMVEDPPPNPYIYQYPYPPCYKGTVEFTQYWVPRENDWDEDQKGRRIFLGGNQPKVPLLGDMNETLAMIPQTLFDKCKMEGTCLLANGDLINLSPDTDNAFRIIGQRDRQHNLFGLGAEEQNLVPFVSVAANDLPQGTTLYLQDLDGMELPTGAIHNGCLRVDDVAWSYEECHIDLFVVSYVDYMTLDLDNKANFEIIPCTIQNFVTSDYLAYVGASFQDEVVHQAMNDTYINNYNKNNK